MTNLKQKQAEALELMKSGKNVFLTGKAGTGKSFVTELFTEWAEENKKKILICAPTGIAALNIGGSTIHRAFGIPIDYVKSSAHLGTRKEIMEVLASADILLVDEVSMLRADVFSHVEYKLRDSVFDSNAPFADKQIIVVGDFYQLPPVVKQNEKIALTKDYGGTYAFETNAWKNARFKMVELDEVVRQNDVDFIDALNSIREKNVYSDKALGYINGNATATDKDDIVTLCFTNKAADQINKSELEKIDELPMQFNASVSGNVKESDKPVPEFLELKIGAKIIFCINDQNGRFVNGTTGHVTGLTDEFVIIDGDIELDKHTWEVKEPTLNNETGKIEYGVIGTYKQYPIKLAWAITIHKSQGQTITGRVHLEMDGSFRPHGSLYVALSRCTDIANLSLDRPLGSYDLSVDESVRTALLSMSHGMTAIEIPAYSLPFFQAMQEIIDLNPTERQLTGMLNRLGDWKEKVRQQN
jgi:ATP-dependent exoDNAse (exonuclease V) alpha subunit